MKKVIIIFMVGAVVGLVVILLGSDPEEDLIKQKLAEQAYHHETTLEQLKGVNLSGLNIQNIGALAKQTALEELDLSNNNIISIDAVSGLTNMVILDLSNNNIRDLSPLKNLKKLRFLNLSRNNFLSLEPLISLPSLEGLILTGNNLADLNNLNQLGKLRTLHISQATNILDKMLYEKITNALPECTVIVVPEND